MRSRCKALDEARREQWLWSRGVHDKQIGTRLEYRSPEYLALEKAEKEWKASPRLVPTYFPRPSGDERGGAVDGVARPRAALGRL